MIASRHAPILSRTVRVGIGTACVLGGMFAGSPLRGSSEDPQPDRVATSDEVQALRAKLESLTAFRAVYRLESKASTGELTLSFRTPNEARFSMRVTDKKKGGLSELDIWLVDGRATTRIHSSEETFYCTASYREPFEFADHVRVALSERLDVLKNEKAPACTPSIVLSFVKDPKDPDRLGANASAKFEVYRDAPRVKWFPRKKDWESARRIGDRIVVEQDDCRYRFAIDTGFLMDATIADRGTVTLRELQMDVDADEFVPPQPEPGAEEKSVEVQRGAWRDGLELARQYAFLCLREQDEAGKLDETRLEMWQNVLAEHYETCLPMLFTDFALVSKAEHDRVIGELTQAREDAQGDSVKLEALEVVTKQIRDRLEADGEGYVDRYVKTFAVPDLKLASALGDRGLEAEHDALRAAGKKVLIEPLLQRFDKSVAAINERK